MNRKPVFILTLGVFGLINTQLGMIGLLPMLAARYGISVSTAGLAVSLFSLAVAASAPILPLLASRFDRKVSLSLVLLVFTVGNLVAAIAPSFPLLLVACVVPAIFFPVFVSLAFSTAAASVAPADAPKAVSRVMVGVSLGMIVGVSASGWLAAAFSVSAGFLYFAAVNGAALLAVLFLLPSMPPAGIVRYGSQLGILKEGRVWASIAAIVFLNGAVFGVYSYLPEFLGKVAQAPAGLVSGVMFAYGLMNIVGNLIAGSRLGKGPVRFVLLYAAMLAGIYLLLTAFGRFTLPVALIVACWGVLGGMGGVVNQHLMASAAPRAPEFANGLFLLATNLGTTVVTAAGGMLLNAFGIGNIAIVGLLFIAVAVPLLFPAMRIGRLAESESSRV